MFDVTVPKRDRTVAVLLRNVPRDVRDKFKGVAHTRGETMQDVIIALMRRYIKDPKVVRR